MCKQGAMSLNVDLGKCKANLFSLSLLFDTSVGSLLRTDLLDCNFITSVVSRASAIFINVSTVACLMPPLSRLYGGCFVPIL
jgi:hypothetical protein